jgi:two-component system sensor histidine kinase UhpB
MPASGSARQRCVPLFWRLFIPNACVLLAASFVLVVEPANGRIVAIAGGLLVLLLINLVLMRRAFAPLTRLTGIMDHIDLLRPGQRIDPPGPASEVTLLAEAFNRMLERLEQERRESGRRLLLGQEAERRRLSSELHDEMGQTLTALVLQLDHAARRVPAEQRETLEEARRTALELIDDVRRLARRLRPELLDELGLPAALENLCDRLSQRTGLPIERSLPQSVPLDPDAQLVVYRVAQESLTNVVRHARARSAELTLAQEDRYVELRVRDDGRGMAGQAPPDSSGLRGMRERALLVDAALTIHERPDGSGTEVRLRVPVPAPEEVQAHGRVAAR